MNQSINGPSSYFKANIVYGTIDLCTIDNRLCILIVVCACRSLCVCLFKVSFYMCARVKAVPKIC